MRKTSTLFAFPFLIAVLAVAAALGYALWQATRLTDEIVTDTNINRTLTVESQLVIVGHNRTAEAGKFGVLVTVAGEGSNLTVTLTDKDSQEVIGEAKFTEIKEHKLIGNYTVQLINNSESASQLLVGITE